MTKTATMTPPSSDEQNERILKAISTLGMDAASCREQARQVCAIEQAATDKIALRIVERICKECLGAAKLGQFFCRTTIAARDTYETMEEYNSFQNGKIRLNVIARVRHYLGELGYCCSTDDEMSSDYVHALQVRWNGR